MLSFNKLKVLIFITSFFFFINAPIFAIDQEEALFYSEWLDTVSDNNLKLSKAYIDENPSKALSFISEAITNSDNNDLKAKCYLQSGIIYNFSFLHKSESALEYLNLAKDIYIEINDVKKLIFTNLIIGEVYRKNGEEEKAKIIYETAYNRAKDINSSYLTFLAYLSKIDLNAKLLDNKDSLLNNLIYQCIDSKLRAYSYFISHKRAIKNQLFNLAIQYLDSAEILYEINESYPQSIDMLIKKAELFELNNDIQKVVQLNEAIYEKSIDKNYGKGLIYSCYKLSDFFESIERYDFANPYLKYINKIGMAEGEKELNQRIMLAEKEKKIDLERISAKNEVKYQGYLTMISFGAALLILALAIYIYFAYKSKSELATDLLSSYNNNEQLKKEKDDFLAYTTHEIRTPLSAVISASELLDRTNLNNSQKKHLGALKNSASNILFLVNDILDLAKLEKRKIVLEKIPFSPVKVIDKAISILNSKAIDNSVKVEFIYDKTFPKSILGDSFRFQQIIVNLLDNAIKYAPNGKAIISLELYKENNIKVSVKDNGSGINKDKLKIIFQPYAQEKTNTSRQYGGTGLGLAICDLIIKLMKGKIEVESSSLGTEFSFVFSFEKASSQTLSSNIKSEVPIKNINILMAEDDELNGKLFQDLIENSTNNIKVDWVKNGEEVIKEIATKNYDIILMDIEMPIKNGFQTSQEIRNYKDPNIKNIPIIAMTAHLVEDVLQRCDKSGMNDCISKPFQIEMLYKKIFETINSTIDPIKNSPTNKAKYLKIFKRTFKEDYRQLSIAMEGKDVKTIERKLHKMKGSSATMDFSVIAETLKRMESKKIVDLSEDLIQLKKQFHEATNESLEI